MRVLFYALALALCAMACSADSEPCDRPAQLAAIDAASAPASAEDVAAIIDRSCALGGCHLSGPGAGGLVLGRSTAAWRAALVDVPSQQNPAMTLIAPGDPDRSWLVVKILGAFCGETCDRALGCGGAMPPGEPLSDLERATIITWIADGAR